MNNNQVKICNFENNDNDNDKPQYIDFFGVKVLKKDNKKN